MFYIDCILNPLDQFEIKVLFGLYFLDYNFIFTNIDLYLVLSMIFILSIHSISFNFKIISSYYSIVIQSLFETIQNIVINQIGKIKGQSFFPFFFCLFIFILINNLFGMIPYSFSSTSHFILTFTLSFIVVLGGTVLGLFKHKLIFFSLFVPAGCPAALLPLLVLIEFISYLARPISLGLRLAANILSGHMLLNILSGFTYQILKFSLLYLILGLLPLSFVIAFSGLELAIAFIQTQVFVVLASSYINDTLKLH